MPDYFFLRNNSEAYAIFGAIEHLEHLTLKERFTIAKVPLHVPRGARRSPSSPRSNQKDVLRTFTDLIEQYVNGRSPELLEAIENEEIDTSHIFSPVRLPPHYHLGYDFLNRQEYSLEDLSELEEMCHICDCYLWLNTHFPLSFADTDLCLAVKERCWATIDAILLETD